MTPEWVRRPMPLVPEAVVAWDGTAAALAEATASRIVAGAQSLRVMSGAGVLLVVGSVDDLPWVDGVTYLAREDGVLVSTTHTCRPGASLVAEAAWRTAPGREPDEGEGPTLVALCPGRPALVSRMPLSTPLAEQLFTLASGRRG